MLIHESIFFTLYAFDLTTDVDDAENFLDASEKEAVKTMSEKRRREFTLSRYYLKRTLVEHTKIKTKPEKIVIKLTKHGKPTYKDVYFSISHCNNHFIVGFSTTPVGVDIEYCDPKRNWKEIAEKYFTKEEQEWMDGNIRLFYVLWTLKEARFKTEGFSSDPEKKFQNFTFKNKVLLCDGYQVTPMPWYDYIIGMSCKKVCKTVDQAPYKINKSLHYTL